MGYRDISFGKRLQFWLASGLVAIGLMATAKQLGYLDNPEHLETAMAVIFAIWLAITVPLFVLVTGVGRDEK